MKKVILCLYSILIPFVLNADTKDKSYFSKLSYYIKSEKKTVEVTDSFKYRVKVEKEIRFNKNIDIDNFKTDSTSINILKNRKYVEYKNENVKNQTLKIVYNSKEQFFNNLEPLYFEESFNFINTAKKDLVVLYSNKMNINFYDKFFNCRDFSIRVNTTKKDKINIKKYEFSLKAQDFNKIIANPLVIINQKNSWNKINAVFYRHYKNNYVYVDSVFKYLKTIYKESSSYYRIAISIFNKLIENKEISNQKIYRVNKRVKAFDSGAINKIDLAYHFYNMLKYFEIEAFIGLAKDNKSPYSHAIPEISQFSEPFVYFIYGKTAKYLFFNNDYKFSVIPENFENSNAIIFDEFRPYFIKLPKNRKNELLIEERSIYKLEKNRVFSASTLFKFYGIKNSLMKKYAKSVVSEFLNNMKLIPKITDIKYSNENENVQWLSFAFNAKIDDIKSFKSLYTLPNYIYHFSNPFKRSIMIELENIDFPLKNRRKIINNSNIYYSHNSNISNKYFTLKQSFFKKIKNRDISSFKKIVNEIEIINNTILH